MHPCLHRCSWNGEFLTSSSVINNSSLTWIGRDATFLILTLLYNGKHHAICHHGCSVLVMLQDDQVAKALW